VVSKERNERQQCFDGVSSTEFNEFDVQVLDGGVSVSRPRVEHDVQTTDLGLIRVILVDGRYSVCETDSGSQCAPVTTFRVLVI